MIGISFSPSAIFKNLIYLKKSKGQFTYFINFYGH
ncbi:hypothetical protein GFO_1504 [Christiangramia forsetii KT0803]|uniref:Uncharacterized protein n=1 Tax=Christiangramia forsetii (strain DSM 17595 / CGMCC 1.15422 / KT0803) TaxID=411154 RepID=A0M1I1_CHRFK|nr:hypothetical protein GFO_1504 [Christiangramia forsetii KT0803]